MDSLIYVLALVIGILYTVRKLEVQSRSPEAGTGAPEFEHWRTLATRAYSWGSRSSFLLIAVRTLWMFIATKTEVPRALVKLVGLGIDLGWVAALLYALYLSQLARRAEVRRPGADRPAPTPADRGG